MPPSDQSSTKPSVPSPYVAAEEAYRRGVWLAEHHSRSRRESRKLVLITSSPSVAVVSEIAPMWMTASSLRPSSQANRSAGGTTSANWRFAKLRHLPSAPRTSLTTTSVRPASLRLATMFEPMKPAPPVTKIIPIRRAGIPAFLCLRASPGATCGRRRGKRERLENGRAARWTGFGKRANALRASVKGAPHQTMNQDDGR